MKKIFLFAYALFVWSCGHKTKVNKSEEVIASVPLSFDTTLVKGNIYPNIHCQNDNSISYALYLPSNYDTSKRFPVLYFFDAHAEGLLPVEKYQELADKYDFIFIGNNNSRNGLDIEVNTGFGNKMFEDATQRLSIDKNRMYVSGFSGGAKVAGYTALHHPEIKGVISCGAALPITTAITGQPFFYIGIAGNEDFNYTEMQKQQEDFDQLDLNHEFLTFNGKHEWCPVKVMNEAIIGMELDAMRKKITQGRQELVDNFISDSEREISLLEKAGKDFELYNLYNKVINFLEGLHDVSAYRKKVDGLKNSIRYQQEEKLKTKIYQKEIELKKQYAQLLSEKEEQWWDSEVKNMKQRMKTELNKEEVRSQKRILNYLSLAAYMYSNNAINQNNVEAAIHFLNIYKIIDPSNAEHEYLLAEMFAQKGEYDKTVKYLQEAANLGFKDLTRFTNDSLFIPMKNLPAYGLVIEKINLNMKSNSINLIGKEN